MTTKSLTKRTRWVLTRHGGTISGASPLQPLRGAAGVLEFLKTSILQPLLSFVAGEPTRQSCSR